ncbi:MAG: hypothetical protein IKD27_00770 [Oscillospiraceae bacterium]|nr:hypothetical protein [Oscillospiraceae bacterium]
MKHLRLFLPLLVLALILSACAGSADQPYTHTGSRGTLEVDPIKGTITHGRDVYTFTVHGEVGGTADYKITYPNGATYTSHVSKSGGVSTFGSNWSGNYNDVSYIPGEYLVSVIEAGAPRERIGDPLAGIVLIVLGFVNFCFPKLPFYLRYGWAIRDAEPTEIHTTMAHVGGILAMIFGLVFCFI